MLNHYTMGTMHGNNCMKQCWVRPFLRVTSQPHARTLSNCPTVHFHFILQHLRKWEQPGCIKKWRNGSLSYRFTGKETKIFCHKFMTLIKAISCDKDDPIKRLQLCAFAYVGLQLRDSVSRFSRVTVDETVMGELSESCRKYFNASAMFLNNVTPTVWTIGYAVSYHVGLLYKKFSLGLGINTMQGREAKHVRISQYAKHATLSTRWRLVMRHDYVTAVWLRKLEPLKLSYHKCTDVYVPKSIELPHFCYCGLEKPFSSAKCSFCSSELYWSIATGKLDAYLLSLLSASY